MSKEAMKLALEAAYLAGFYASGEGYNGEYPFNDQVCKPQNDANWVKNRDDALREALAEQPAQQEPVAWMSDRAVGFKRSEFGATPTVPLYTSPPAQRKPLTDDEIWGAYVKSPGHVGNSSLSHLYAFARAIEAKLKEKNT